MKPYIQQALKDLKSSDDIKIDIHLKERNDYKKNIFRLGYNRLILTLQKKIVPCHFKNFLLRTTGMKVGHDACVPHDITFDYHFPELIDLGAGCLVGGESRIITHEIDHHTLTIGKCVLKERTLLGGLSALRPGSLISKDSMLNMYSELQDTVPQGQLYGGVPARHMSTFSEADIEKFFKLSDGNHKGYYKEFKEKVNVFLKDPKQTYFKIYYNGKRLNAGNDWWRARNIFRIWYNGAIIEFTRLLGHSGFKTFLLRIAGVKIGKNCKIGKGVVFDHIFCDTIALEDDVTLDDHVYIDGHEYTMTQTVFGKVTIGKGAHLKHHVYVRTGTTVGENTIIEPYSMAQREIPADEVWGGVPAKHIRKRH